MPVVCICGAKGGSLKTATALSLSSLLVGHGSHVALVDLDPQHSATLALPVRIADGNTELSCEGVEDPIGAPPVEIRFAEWTRNPGRLSLYRGGRGLIAAKRFEIRRRLESITADVTIVDTIPAIGEIVIGAMEQADLIVIPTEATADALRVLPGVVNTAREVAPPHCRIRLMLSRIDMRERITADAREVLERAYPGLLYKTAIPSDVRAKEASGHLRPVVLYAPECRAAQAYRGLLREIVQDLGIELGNEKLGGSHGAE